MAGFPNKLNRLVQMLLTAICLNSMGIISANAQGQPSERANDPRYGVALWHYFQNEHFSALTELMVAEARGGIQGHADNPALMKAGLKMAYGMPLQAEADFRELLTSATGPNRQTEDAAWYYLAELTYRQGNPNRAAGYLEQTSFAGENPDKRNQPSSIQQKANDLYFNMLLSAGDVELAEHWLKTANLGNPVLGWFNLGNALAREGQLQSALEAFDTGISTLAAFSQIKKDQIKKGQIENQGLELGALWDKIHTAAGYAALRNNQAPLAQSYFSQVQQGGETSSLALLGIGRASMESGSYQQALGYYQALGQSKVPSNAVLEGRLAVPLVYERMNRPGIALGAYDQAIAGYQQEIRQIDDSIEQFMQQGLTLGPEFKTAHWLSPANRGTSDVPANTYLASLYVESRFQSRLKELGDLLELTGLMQQMQLRTELLGDSLQLRESNRIIHRQAYEDLDSSSAYSRIERQLQQQRNRISQSENNADYLAFSSVEDQRLLNRIDASLARVINLERDGTDLGRERTLLEKYRGLLLWKASQDYADNLYIAGKELSEAEARLAELAFRSQQVADLLNNAPELQSYWAQLGLAEQNIGLMDTELDSKVVAIRDQLLSIVVAELNSRKDRLQAYLAEAQLARLRIFENQSLAAMTRAEAEVSQ